MTIKKSITLAIFATFIIVIVYYFYPEDKLPINSQIDHIVAYKSKRQLQVYSNGNLLKIYKISLGRQPIGDKEFEGDNKTPEGLYYIYGKNPNSICHKNLGISYPNKEDIKKAKQLGKVAGGDIKIHGMLNNWGFISKFHRWLDLTYGCMMVTDGEIDELYKAVKIGTPIEILP